MVSLLENDKHRKAISASWDRCKHQFSLVPEAVYPVLRLQSTEVSPRLEAMVDRTGGRRGIFQQLSEIAAKAGHCLVLCDPDQVVVRVESRQNTHSQYERRGIALGSCWSERIAGTNGVSMAMDQGEAVTVRGKDHFFSKLHVFSCTSVPLLDACHRKIGAVSLSSIDSGNEAEYMFAQQLLEQAARRIQGILFEQHHKDALILTVSNPSSLALSAREELIAVDGSGRVLGTTAGTGLFPHINSPGELNGTSLEAMVGLSIDDLFRESGQAQTVHFDTGDILNISVCKRTPVRATGGRRDKERTKQQHNFSRKRLPPALRELSTGSQNMTDTLEQIQVCFTNTIPLLVEGESGTGKTELVKALHTARGHSLSQLVTVDCAAIEDSAVDELQIDVLLGRARAAQTQQAPAPHSVTLLFENIGDLTEHAQTRLRTLLETIESDEPGIPDLQPSPALHFVATSRVDLRTAVDDGQFREDLYYFLCGAHFSLPALRDRESPDALAHVIAARLAGTTIDFTAEASQAIRTYDWPGNVRELRNTLRQSLIAGNGARISLGDMALFSRPGNTLASRARPTPPNTRPEKPLSEKAELMDALLSANWNVTRAARSLGISRATIHRKMIRQGIVRPARED